MASGGAKNQETPRREQEDGEPEDYEPEVNFTPVIPLPDKVEVVTGEEEEEVLLEDKAKLYRWDANTKEWKERGVGQAKILRRKDTGKVRFLMRREQTFKVCANHTITDAIKIQPMKGQAKARIWGAQDFADEELKDEKFCIRFKTEEQAAAFEAKFVEATELSKKAVDSPVKGEKKEEKKGVSLAQFASAQKAGKWECGACLTSNPVERIQCLACEGAQPGKEEEVAKLKADSAPAPAVMTIGAGGGFKFGGGATTTQASGFNFGSPASTAAPPTATANTTSSGFTFGSPSVSTGFGSASSSVTSSSTSTTSLGGFTFKQAPVIVKPKQQVEVEEKKKETVKPSPFSGFSFGSGSSALTSALPGAKAEIVSSTLSAASEPLMFGSKPAQGFDSVAAAGGAFKADPNFQGFAGAGSSVFGAKKEEGGEEGGADEEYEPTGEFTPVIPLPELIEVKTGEEGEEVLFSERAVLFRFVQDTKEWKERGRGDFKILKNPTTGKARFLMRREQVVSRF